MNLGLMDLRILIIKLVDEVNLMYPKQNDIKPPANLAELNPIELAQLYHELKIMLP